MKRTATAIWNGSGKEGSGNLTTQSSTLNKTQYSFKSRFEQGVGTNPEELIAAAHAGFTPDSLEATATVSLDDGTITSSNIVLNAKVPGIDAAKFKTCADDAKANCPVSKLLNTSISLEANLV
jgi:lipoyl-dependent peroxiredoxin